MVGDQADAREFAIRAKAVQFVAERVAGGAQEAGGRGAHLHRMVPRQEYGFRPR